MLFVLGVSVSSVTSSSPDIQSVHRRPCSSPLTLLYRAGGLRGRSCGRCERSQASWAGGRGWRRRAGSAGPRGRGACGCCSAGLREGGGLWAGCWDGDGGRRRSWSCWLMRKHKRQSDTWEQCEGNNKRSVGLWSLILIMSLCLFVILKYETKITQNKTKRCSKNQRLYLN